MADGRIRFNINSYSIMSNPRLTWELNYEPAIRIDFNKVESLVPEFDYIMITSIFGKIILRLE